MAVGILGIGLTMVASVFPVAVDQNRRSRETTMATLCARSTVAMLRARRDMVVPGLRGSGRDTTMELTNAPNGLPDKFRVYNPDSFLYEQGRTYTVDAAYPTWLTGNYVPVVLATPVTTDTARLGPWRVTVLVYKSRGSMPDNLNAASGTAGGGKYMKGETINRVQPGGYIVDWRGPASTETRNMRGEAYLVDNVKAPTSTSGATTDTIYLAAPISVATGTNVTSYVMATGSSVAVSGSASGAAAATRLPNYVSMPGAIAAFHTIIGE
jgi:hypothetical protein